MSDSANAVIDYTNYKGERSKRRIQPIRLALMESQFHPGEQYILVALDLDKGAVREFAMKDIHKWWSEPDYIAEFGANYNV